MGMGTWLAFGLGAALGDSGADVLTKRYFVQPSPYGMALVRLLGAVPFLALVGLGLSLPELTPPFWFIVAAMLPLEAIALLLYMQALRVCHLSLCVPFLAFTPVFMIFTGWLVLGERLNRWGVAGTMLIALGSYILGLGADGNAKTGVLAPLKALARERGARLMLLVAAIYSVTAALYKSAILHSGAGLFRGDVSPGVHRDHGDGVSLKPGAHQARASGPSGLVADPGLMLRLEQPRPGGGHGTGARRLSGGRQTAEPPVERPPGWALAQGAALLTADHRRSLDVRRGGAHCLKRLGY